MTWMKSCTGAGYTGCVACGAGPHQPCRQPFEADTWTPEKDPVYDSKIYQWMEKRFNVPRSTFVIFAVLGFLLGLSTCGMFT